MRTNEIKFCKAWINRHGSCFLEDDVFEIAGQNNTFLVSEELSQILQNAPKATVNIRLVAESGEAIDSEIGEGTVEA